MCSTCTVNCSFLSSFSQIALVRFRYHFFSSESNIHNIRLKIHWTTAGKSCNWRNLIDIQKPQYGNSRKHHLKSNRTFRKCAKEVVSYRSTTVEVWLCIRNRRLLDRNRGHSWWSDKALSCIAKDEIWQEVILHFCPNLEHIKSIISILITLVSCSGIDNCLSKTLN